MPLRHSSPDCAGTWGIRTVNGGSYWKCDLCVEIDYPSPAIHAAAIRENSMGNTLEQLTTEGRKLLEGA